MHRWRPLLLAALTAFAGCAGPLAGPPGSGLEAASPAVVRAATGVRLGTFEWNVDDAVGRWKAGTLWAWLRVHHVDDILAGFDDAQLNKYSHGSGETEFNAFVADCARRNVQVELLLGTPRWILPSGVYDLESVMHQMSGMHFSALNLDLEPNEVSGVPMRHVIDDLIAVMKQYVAASPWPVYLDVNWIYADSARTGGVCLLCGLQSGGLQNVVLMTYISTPSTVYANDAPILEKYPSLKFWIAQSVEPPSVLPPGDSYWADGFAKFYADMNALNATFGQQPNYQGITIESMQYLESMKH